MEIFIGLENICMVAYTDCIKNHTNLFDNRVEIIDLDNNFSKITINDLTNLNNYLMIKKAFNDISRI